MNELNEKKKLDWIIHGVIGENGNIVYHTHGLDAFGMLELELNLNLPQKNAMAFTNLIAMHLTENNIVIKDEYYDDTIFSCPVFFKKVKGIYGDGEENIRIIFPDPNMNFPWDDGCQEPFKNQINNDL